MSINYIAVLSATIVQFIVGAVWFGPIFGKLWGRIHGFDLLPEEKQREMMKDKVPYIFQFIMTVLMTFVFALLRGGFPAEWNVYGLAGFFWLGFIVPTQVGAVLWGGTPKEWRITKTALMAGGSLLSVIAMTFVLEAMR